MDDVPSFDKVLFEARSSAVDAVNHVKLMEIAQYMRRRVEPRYAVVGHADRTEPAGEQQRLSEARAAAVRDRLIEMGVEPDRLVAFGRGAAEPIDGSSNEPGRGHNRRVDIRVLDRHGGVR